MTRTPPRRFHPADPVVVSDVPRGPENQQPEEPGWWRASDGKWYPPEAAMSQTEPVASPDPTAPMPKVLQYEAGVSPRRSFPLWLKISAPVAAVLVVAAVAVA